MPRVLAVDLGKKWIGLAISDEEGSIAYPLEVAAGNEKALERIILQHRREGGRSGRHRTPPEHGRLRRSEGSGGTRLRGGAPEPDPRSGRDLGRAAHTMEAERYLREAEVPRRRWREKVNQMAAQILLQSWLDARRGRLEGRGGGDPLPEAKRPR